MIAQRLPRSSTRANSRGFTIIELLIVIGIIVILAGMTFAAWPAIQVNIKKKSTLTFLRLIETGLESYKLDNGIYPVTTEFPSGSYEDPQARESLGLEGAVDLYKNLSGDFDMDPEGLVDDDQIVYIERLAYYYTKQEGGLERAYPHGEGFAVVDPFANPIRYIANSPNDEEGNPLSDGERDTININYDLWSIVNGSPEGTSEDQARWLTNWRDF